MSAIIQLPHSIKLYRPENDTPEKPSSRLTLRQLYDEHLAVEVKTRSRKTEQDYQTILSDWERLMNDLPVSELSRSTLLEFRERLQLEKVNGKFRSPATINKKFRVLGRFVRLCWPPDSHNPGGLNLCDYFLLPSRLPEEETLPRIFSYEELNSLYRACDAQTWPRRNPAIIWKTIIVMHHCLGPRTYDLLELNWEDVDWDFKGLGAVSFQATKTRKLQRLPLAPVARKHLEKLKEVSLSSKKVFPGFSYSNTTTVNRHWKKLAKRAGLSGNPHMEDMRKTCNTDYNDRWPGVGDWILGHSLGGVNARNYYNPTRIVLKAVQELPRPSAFDSLS